MTRAMAQRYQVPPLARYEPTILREARYWAARFRGVYTVDDLKQEGWLVALRVMQTYDATRGMKVETLLTIALRRHYSMMVRAVVVRAIPDDVRDELRALPRDFNPVRAYEAGLLLKQLRALPDDQQSLARELIDHDGSVRALATARRWPISRATREVRRLREALSS